MFQFSVFSSLTFTHQDLLDKFSILFIRHDPLDHFCPCVTFLWANFQFCPFVTIIMTTCPSPCSERVLDDRRNRRLDKALPNSIHNNLPSSTTGTQVHVFVWCNSGSGPRYLVCASLGFSSPDILGTRNFPERTWCCTHKSPTAKCRTFPNPSKLTAVPYLLLLPSPLLPIRTLHCSRPGLPKSWTTLSRIGHSKSQHLPLWIFLWSGNQQSLHHQTPQCYSLHEYLQIIRGYVIVYRATLLRAVKSCVRGEAIFRINSFAEYKKVWPVHSKEIEPRRHALEQLEFFSNEKIILLSDLLQRIVPFCRSAQLTDFIGVGPTHVVGSKSRHTPSIGQPQSLQGTGNVLLVWLVLYSPLSQRQCSAQEARSP